MTCCLIPALSSCVLKQL
uniref:Uncharacterized protein n=1 Tax=Anguilla anguilla TaxID=7936 RepID=A0A0E9REM6_ANGAN